MSVWTSLLGWAIKTAKTEGQTVGLKAVQDATVQLNAALQQHAPDMATALTPLLQQVVQGAVAGILTRTH